MPERNPSVKKGHSFEPIGLKNAVSYLGGNPQFRLVTKRSKVMKYPSHLNKLG